MKKPLVFLTLLVISATPLLGMYREKQVVPFMDLEVTRNQPSPSHTNPPVSFRGLELSHLIYPPNPIRETDVSHKEESHCCRNHVRYSAYCVFACLIGTSAAYDCCCAGQGCSKEVKYNFEESKKICSGATHYFFCICR